MPVYVPYDQPQVQQNHIMVQTCHSPMKSPIEPISAVLDEIRDLAQEFVRFEFDELRSADKSLKGVLEREGGIGSLLHWT